MGSGDICLECGAPGFHTAKCPKNRINWDNAVEFSPITAASIEFKTIYDDLTDQGFTEAQAIYLVAAQITGNPGIAPGLPVEKPN